MKALYKILLPFAAASAALTLAAPTAQAQTPETDNIVVDKRVDQTPDENGVRWITLESYTTGAVKVQTISRPADIILVLDTSMSMEEEDYFAASGDLTTVSSVTYSNLSSSSSRYYVKVGDEYFLLKATRTGGGGNRRYTFYYTNAEGNDVTLQGPGSSDTYTSSALYSQYGEYISRLDALKQSVEGFLRVVYANDSTSTAKDPDYAGDRVAIISYNSDTTHVTNGFQDIGTNLGTMIDAARGMRSSQGTRADLGMQAALNLLASARESSSKTVVMFTDGVPTTSRQFNQTYANSAVNYAKAMKDTTGTGYGATVYTIGLFNEDADDWDDRVPYYMNYMSSNYPTASAPTDGTNNYTPGSGNWNGEYMQMAGDNDLTAIFAAIAQNSGGYAGSLKEDALVDVDIVSNSFSLPAGTIGDHNYGIEIYVAQCTGYDDEGKGNAFGTPIYVPNNNGANFADADTTRLDPTLTPEKFYSVDSTYHTYYNESISIIQDGNEIETTGFNFAKNFCGRRASTKMITDANPNGYYADGYKLIVKIPIVVNDDAVGGAGTVTNEPGSGIYIKNEDGTRTPVIAFPIPTVSIPINIWIKKYGLNKGESAIFNIQRCKVGKDSTVTANWEDFTSVVITGTGEYEGSTLVSPLAKLNGLSELYHYRVIEEGWSWSYRGGAQGANTTYDLQKNPFIFSNTKKNTSIHHAESKAINVFGPEQSATTIDSREYLKTSGSGSSE